MKLFNNKTLAIAALSVCSFTSSIASATETIIPQKIDGFYMGAGYGTSKISGGIDQDDSPRAVKLIVGYQINRVIGIESQYTHYEDSSVAFAKVANDFSAESASLAFNLGYTFTNDVRPFVTLGASYMSLGSAPNHNKTTAKAALRTGVGIEFSPAELEGLSFRFALENDRFKAAKKDMKDAEKTIGLSSVYAGMLYKF